MIYPTWGEWLAANPDADEATKLDALRGSIVETAKLYVNGGEITAQWADKKLAKLGIATRLSANNQYQMEAHASGKVVLTVYAANRADALVNFADRTTSPNLLSIADAAVQNSADDVVFLSGPEDPSPAGDPDAPTTVDATLTMLREIILLGNIAGPRFDCDTGSNEVLAQYGLAPVPERKMFTIGVPVEGVLKTTVEAYDEESARRVGGWRWDNNRTSYELDHVVDTDSAIVVEV